MSQKETVELNELAVIGSCLVEKRALQIASEMLEPEFFTQTKFAVIFRVMQRMLKENVDVDFVTLETQMTPQEILDCGGRPELLHAVDQVPTALNVQHYARAVRSFHFRRQLAVIVAKHLADPSDVALRKQLRDCWDEIDGIGAMVVDMDDGLFAWHEDFGLRGTKGRQGFRTNFSKFDHITGGVSRGDLVTFGARTSRGKTSALISLASRYFLDYGHRVLFVTAEMTANQIMDRLVSINSGVSLSRIRYGMKEESPNITAAMDKLHRQPFFIADLPRLTMGRLYQAIQDTGPDIVMVDYIQRFAVPEKVNNRAGYFSDVANNLKYLAKHRNVAIFACSQLNRGMEFGKEREPSLADLKESGGIEEASDIVVLIHSPTDAIEGVRQVEFIVAKNRNGMLGRVPFEFVEFTTAFREADPEPALEETHKQEKTSRFDEGKRKDLFS